MITQWENYIFKSPSADFDLVVEIWLFWGTLAKIVNISFRFDFFSSYLSLGRSDLGKFCWECRSNWNKTFPLLQQNLKMLSYFHFWGFICRNFQDFAQVQHLFIISQPRKVRPGQILLRVQISPGPIFPLLQQTLKMLSYFHLWGLTYFLPFINATREHKSNRLCIVMDWHKCVCPGIIRHDSRDMHRNRLI